MEEEFWKPTAQMFSSLFTKPKMSDKLLQKPPFRYIFDIINETANQTGFSKGLYSSEELDVNYYQNKENKIIYLKKAIDLVKAILNEDL